MPIKTPSRRSVLRTIFGLVAIATATSVSPEIVEKFKDAQTHRNPINQAFQEACSERMKPLKTITVNRKTILTDVTPAIWSEAIPVNPRTTWVPVDEESYNRAKARNPDLSAFGYYNIDTVRSFESTFKILEKIASEEPAVLIMDSYGGILANSIFANQHIKNTIANNGDLRVITYNANSGATIIIIGAGENNIVFENAIINFPKIIKLTKRDIEWLQGDIEQVKAKGHENFTFTQDGEKSASPTNVRNLERAKDSLQKYLDDLRNQVGEQCYSFLEKLDQYMPITHEQLIALFDGVIVHEGNPYAWDRIDEWDKLMVLDWDILKRNLKLLPAAIRSSRGRLISSALGESETIRITVPEGSKWNEPAPD